MSIRVVVYEDNNIISKYIKPAKERVQLDYTPSPTINKFMKSNHHFRILIGPLAGGKTTGAAVELFRRACQTPADSEGVRKSRVFVLSKGFRESTLLSIQNLFPESLWNWNDRDSCLTFKFNDVESIWYFSEYVNMRGEYTWGWIENARDWSTESILDLYARVGRYPRAVENWGLILTTLPPPAWGGVMEFRHMLAHTPADIFVQPSALSAEAENVENLTPEYYQIISAGRSEQWKDEYLRQQGFLV